MFNIAAHGFTKMGAQKSRPELESERLLRFAFQHFSLTSELKLRRQLGTILSGLAGNHTAQRR